VYDAECTSDQFRCPDGRCISSSWLCDLDDDCGDLADEQGCTSPNPPPATSPPPGPIPPPGILYTTTINKTAKLICIMTEKFSPHVNTVAALFCVT